MERDLIHCMCRKFALLPSNSLFRTLATGNVWGLYLDEGGTWLTSATGQPLNSCIVSSTNETSVSKVHFS